MQAAKVEIEAIAIVGEVQDMWTLTYPLSCEKVYIKTLTNVFKFMQKNILVVIDHSTLWTPWVSA